MPVGSWKEGNQLAQQLIATYAKAEKQLQQTLVDQIRKGWNTNDTYEKLMAAHRARRAAEQIRDRLDQLAPQQAQALVRQAFSKGAGHALTDLGKLGGLTDQQLYDLRRTTPGAQAILTVADRLTTRLKSTHLQIVRFTDDVYRKAVMGDVTNLLGGLETQQQARRRILNRLLGKGVTGFTDRAGRNWNLSTYVKMASSTTAAHAAIEGYMGTLEQANVDLVVISDHLKECDRCAPWEGKVLNRGIGPVGRIEVRSAVADETVSVEVAGNLQDAIADGLFHPNCAHNAQGFIPGANEQILRDADTHSMLNQSQLTDPSQLASVNYYSGAGHQAINSNILNGIADPNATNVSAAIEAQAPTTFDMMVYRGVTSTEPHTVGMSVPHPQFMSTTSDYNVAQKFANQPSNGTTPTVYRIHVPKGNKALDMNAAANPRYPDEHEILFPTGRVLVVQAVRTIDGMQVVDAIMKT